MVQRSSPPPPARFRPHLEELEDRALPAAGAREQYMLELINRFRTNPAGELSLLLNSGDANVNSALAFFNVNRTTLQAQWNTLTPVAPLAWNDALGNSALTHSQLMHQYDQQSHDLPGEPSLLARVQNAGYPVGGIAENAFAFARSVFHSHAGFAIDWGNGPGGIQNPAGHRENLMDPEYREIGLGLVDATPGKQTGPLLVTHHIGRRLLANNPFLLGVVYRDANANNFYDVGEGLSGVTVQVAGPGGTFNATTQPGGGYQVQVPAGSYTVGFSGGGLTAPVSRSATVAGSNVKVDVNAQTTPVAPVVQMSAATASGREGTTATLTLSRSGDTNSAVSIRVSSTDGTARAGVDYNAVGTTVSFAAGETQKTVPVTLLANTAPDGDRTLTLTLTNPTGGALVGAPAQTLLTILDDDQTGQLGFASATFRASEGTGQGTITVRRSNGVRGSVSVAYSTTDGTAQSGRDFQAASGTLTFGDGEASKTITLALFNETLVERPETLTFTLTSPTGGASLAGQTTTTLQIDDDDIPSVPSGPPPVGQVGAAFLLSQSREHYEDFVTRAYRRYLGRGTDGSGLNFWATLMQNGLSQEQLEANLLGSPEYIANHGGTGPEWVRGMYRDLLGREPSDSEVGFWAGHLANGLPTYTVAFGFAASAEREGQRVRENYRTFLQREANSGEAQFWVDVFLRGYSNEVMVAGFVASLEYYNNPQKGQGNIATWVASAYRDILFRDPTRSEVEGFLRTMGIVV